MFRPLLVRPSSVWIPWSEEIYNSAIQLLKTGGDEISFTKIGVCAEAIGINIYVVYTSLW